MDSHPVWEIDWVVKFLSEEKVETLEDPTNSPDAISGREELEDESEDSTEFTDSTEYWR